MPPVSFGTAFVVRIGGFNTLPAIVTSQAGIFPIHIRGDNAPLVVIGIIRMLIRFPYGGFAVRALRAKDAAIGAHVIDGISAGPSVGGQFAVFVTLQLHSAPPWVCRSMPAFRIL